MFAAALCPGIVISAQNKADSLRLAYDFEGAVELCENEMSNTSDSLELAMWDSSLILAQNGMSMTDYCYEPDVVAKVKLGIDDFYLFYPMENGAWRKLPNQLDSSFARGFVQALYVPEDAEEVFFSAADSLGHRDIFETHLLDSLWAAPASIYDMITVDSDEIYPVLDPDGSTLYFASDGLYGMGGFDLYSCEWNEEDQTWGMPVNLGFPFSSPYDDFLYYNTRDGRYTIFASNRETSKDSVYVYVLAFDSTPIRKSITDIDRLREVAGLNPKSSSRLDNSSALAGPKVENSAIERYSSQVSLVKSLRDSLYRFHDRIDIPEMQARLNEAVKTMQQLEMDFLSSGQSFDLSAIQKASQREVVGAESGYTFSKNELGGDFAFAFAVPEEVIDENSEDAVAAPKPKPTSRRAKSNAPVQITRYRLLINPEDGRALPSSAIAVIRQSTDKDIIRHSEEGVVTFEVGLFDHEAEVNAIIDLLKENGAPDCSIEEEIITQAPN